MGEGAPTGRMRGNQKLPLHQYPIKLARLYTYKKMKALPFKTLIICIFFLLSCSAWAETLTIQINGIQGKLLQNAQKRLNASKPRQLNPRSLRGFMRQADEEITAATAPFGYYSPQIDKQLRETNQGWLATFNVDAGKPVIIEHLTIHVRGEGANTAQILAWRKNIKLAVGKIFNSEDYNNAKRDFFTLTSEYGFLRAEFVESQVIVNTDEHSANIILIADTGPQFYFSQIHFSPNPMSTAFLKRYASFSPGQPYRAEKLREFQQNLNNSNYFQSVLVSSHQSTENTAVPVQVDLTARKSKHYLFGLGYGTDTGVRGTLGVEFRRLTSTGQKFNAQLQASQVLTNLQANYIIPGKNPVTDQYALGAAIAREDQVNGDGTIQKIAASYQTVFKGWQQVLALTLQRERYTLLNLPQQTDVLLVPSINWLKTDSDNPLKPTRGSKINLSLQGSPDLFNTSPFLQAALSAKRIQPFGDNWRGVVRGNLGYTAIDNINNLPLSFQLFAGGAQSVRGYSYNLLGPGKYQFVASAELQRRIRGNWFLGAFYDSGSVSDQFLGDRQNGVGLNLLWQSPIGALQLSVGKAISMPGNPTLIQFSMGPEL